MAILLTLEKTHIGIPIKNAYAKVESVIIDNNRKSVVVHTAVYGSQGAYDADMEPMKRDHFEFTLEEFDTKVDALFDGVYKDLQKTINLDESDKTLSKAVETFKNKVKTLIEPKQSEKAFNEFISSIYDKLKTIKDPHFPETDYTQAVDAK
jgi:hypothetical protein